MAKSRRMLCGALALMLALCLCGCAQGEGTMQKEAGAARAASADGGDANLRDVSVEQDGDATVARLSFVNGSRYGDVEESELPDAPEYELVQLEGPPRLMISAKARYADYAEDGTPAGAGLVRAIFDSTPGGNGAETRLYLQLASPVDVSESTDGSTVVLTLAPREADESSQWHVGLNAMGLYAEGAIPSGLGLTPTLCEDLASTILISDGFSTQEDADAFAQSLRGQLPESVPESATYVFEMPATGLPPYRAMGGSELAASLRVLEKDGAALPAGVLLDNGRYLCTAPDGTICYSVRSVPDATQDVEQVVKEDVWVQKPDGSHEPHGAGQFYDITGAAFSADGRYLAVSDASRGGNILYVYDSQEDRLRNLGEEGLGNYTVSFVWDPERNVIYAMTGTQKTLQLLRYDLEAENGTSGVSSIEERNGAESGIAYADGTLFFADPARQTIYSVDVETGQRAKVASGLDFAVSDNGAYMAVLSQVRGAEAEEISYNLDMMDARTGEELGAVMENAQVGSFFFGAGSDTLYLTTPVYEGVTEEHPFALLSYSVSTGELDLVGYSTTETVLPSRTPGDLYLVHYFTDASTGNISPATYLYTATAA